MKSQRLPRPLLVWGIATLLGDVAVLVIMGVLIVLLFRSGTWTRAEANLWAPILLVAETLLASAVSLSALRWLVLPKVGPRQGEQGVTRNQVHGPPPGPM